MNQLPHRFSIQFRRRIQHLLERAADRLTEKSICRRHNPESLGLHPSRWIDYKFGNHLTRRMFGEECGGIFDFDISGRVERGTLVDLIRCIYLNGRYELA